MSQCGGRNILIVEDNVLELQYLHDTLQKFYSNEKFFFSYTAEHALQIAYKFLIDIFIVDVKLADGNSGIALAKKLRRLPQYLDCPIIFESSYVDSEIDAYRGVRCQTFIPKPLEAEKIISAYQHAVKSIEYHNEKRNSVLRENQVFLILKHNNITHKYRLNEIVLFKSKTNYILVVNYDEERHSLEIAVKRENLKSMGRMLDDIGEGNFVQCNKGFIVNQQYIANIDWTNQILRLKFNNNEKLNQHYWFGEPGKPIEILIGDKYRKNFWQED